MAKTETTQETAAPLTDEQKRVKFEKFAQRRMSNVLTAIGTLRGLANKNQYNFTDAHWEKMFGAIDAALNDIQDRVNGKVAGTVGFGFGNLEEDEQADGAED